MNAASRTTGRHAGIVVAMLEEARSLGSIPEHTDRTTELADGSRVRLCGIGPQRAAVAAQALLDQGACALLSWGTCGALRKGMKAGELLLPITVMDDTGVAYPVDAHWRRQLELALPAGMQASGGLLLSGSRPLATVRDKASAHAATAAAAVDMESAAVAGVAAAANVPFLAVRVVVDRADQMLPMAVLSAVDEIGRPRIRLLLQTLVLRPLQVRHLMALGRSFNQARRTLRQVAACAPGALAFSGERPA